MVILNCLKIHYLVSHDVRKQKKTFVYFLNLAVSDLFLGLLIISVKIMTLFEQKQITLTLINARVFLQMKAVSISLYISVLTFAVLTLERTLAVKKPIYYSLIQFRTKCFISGLIWILSTSIIIITHFTINDDKLEYAFTPGIIISTGVLGTCCYIITKNGLHRKRPKSNISCDIEERKFLTFCIRSFVLFQICWLPLAVFGILFSSGILHNWKYMLEFRFTAHIMAFSNSVGSPILFLSHNCRWRRIFKRIPKSRNFTMNTTSSNLKQHITIL